MLIINLILVLYGCWSRSKS
uniref:Uncharacterized protein n=1 Tax=Rhizophora mucronata TaxID=61149 RepID=A0A2P2JJ50_RHIMU